MRQDISWWSEAALLWLPKDSWAYPEDFPSRAVPGTSDFYYLALDAFHAIEDRRSTDSEREPWAYIVDDHRILSPREIDGLMDEWRHEVRNLRDTIIIPPNRPRTSSSARAAP